MKSSTRQRKAALRVHLESIVAAAHAMDNEMNSVPHPHGLARQSLAYKQEYVGHGLNGLSAKYRASDGEYYTITVQREPHQQALLFEGALLQNISGKAL